MLLNGCAELTGKKVPYALYVFFCCADVSNIFRQYIVDE